MGGGGILDFVLACFGVEYVVVGGGLVMGYLVSGEDPAFGFWSASAVYGVSVSRSGVENAFCGTGCFYG